MTKQTTRDPAFECLIQLQILEYAKANCRTHPPARRRSRWFSVTNARWPGTMAARDTLLKKEAIMQIEIHKPELVQRVNARMETGLFHDADELIEKALDALDERTSSPASPS